MSDQKQHWNKRHQENSIDSYSEKPTDFALEVLRILPPSQKILELGCGVGNDSACFAEAGHTVVATDFSEIAIQKNSQRYKDTSNLTFEMLDMSEPINFATDSFDVVYARLSLHYFTDQVTRKILTEIHRVLKSDGYFCFVCKSTADPLYGKGEQIEIDMFERNGHIRHFFSEEYVISLLKDNFSIEKMESGSTNFYGKESAFIKVIARAEK